MKANAEAQPPKPSPKINVVTTMHRLTTRPYQLGVERTWAALPALSQSGSEGPQQAADDTKEGKCHRQQEHKCHHKEPTGRTQETALVIDPEKLFKYVIEWATNNPNATNS